MCGVVMTRTSSLAASDGGSRLVAHGNIEHLMQAVATRDLPDATEGPRWAQEIRKGAEIEFRRLPRARSV